MQKEIAKKSLSSRLLKHKKIILAAILPLGFWAAIFGLWLHNSNQQSKIDNIVVGRIKQSPSDQKSIDQLAFASSSIDSDNDGLSDWEESVYGTNSSNPDSDDDGYLDGEEILSNHNPLKKGPDDLMESRDDAKSSEKDTATKNLSKIVIENYIKTIQNQDSQNISSDKLSQILLESFDSDRLTTESFNEALKSNLFYFIPPDLDKDIKTSSDNSEKNIKQYWTDINKTLSKIIKNTPSQNLSQTIVESIKNNNHDDLDEIIKYYKDAYENVKIITVPSSLVTSHKNTLTIFYKYWKINEAVKDYKEDPLLALLALNELSNLLQKTITR